MGTIDRKLDNDTYNTSSQISESMKGYIEHMNVKVLPAFDNMRQQTFLGKGGVTLSYVHGKPIVPAKSTIVIVPGRTESYFKYAETIYDLVNLGHEIFAYDHRGQGFSERLLADPQVGYVRDFNDFVYDLRVFLESVVAENKSHDHVFLMAHSMGGALSLALSIHAEKETQKRKSKMELEGLILSAPMLGIKLDFSPLLTEAIVSLRCLFGRDKDYAALPGPFDAATYGKDLTHDPNRLEWYRTALGQRPALQLGMPSNHWMKEALRFCADLRKSLKSESLRCPILLFAPGKDSVVETEFQKLIVLNYKGGLIERIDLPHSAHDPFIETDAVRAVVFRAIEQFIDSVSEKP